MPSACEPSPRRMPALWWPSASAFAAAFDAAFASFSARETSSIRSQCTRAFIPPGLSSLHLRFIVMNKCSCLLSRPVHDFKPSSRINHKYAPIGMRVLCLK